MCLVSTACVPFVRCRVWHWLVGRWNALQDAPDKVSITHGNVVQYASNAYLTTLLKNYTTQGLGSHVLWTIRYLVTAAGGDWGRMRQEVASTLCNKDTTVVYCLRAGGAVALALPLWLRPTVQALLERWNAVAGPAAKYTANSSPSASLHLRWWCLRLLKHAQAPFPQGIPVTITKNKGGKKVQEVIVVHPKYFKLTPICKRAAPFITLDNLWVQRVLGLSTLSAHGPNDSVEFDDGEVHDITATLNAIAMASGKKKGRPKTHEHLEDRLHPFRPLELIFGQASTVKRWFKGPRGTTLPFPSTVRTDGVQLHVPIEVLRTVPADVAASLKDGRERKSKDPLALAAQLRRPDGKGEFAEVAAATLLRPNQDALVRPHVGVDPGYILAVAASHGYTITRKDFYHGRMEPRRRTFAPNGGGGGGGGGGDGGAGNVPPPAHRRDFTTSGHSRRSRNNCAPQAVVDGETALSNHPPGVTLTDFDGYLAVYFQHVESHQRWYGSRTQRSARFVRAGRTRAIFARVINGVAPDPLTVVVFGGSYSGRGCMRGDTGGPAPIKALRRAIARQRIEVVVDEFRSTITHSTCGSDLIPRPHDPTGREKFCPTCQVDVPRDIDAARSIDSIWDSNSPADSLVRTGRRPAHLRRP